MLGAILICGLVVSFVVMIVAFFWTHYAIGELICFLGTASSFIFGILGLTLTTSTEVSTVTIDRYAVEENGHFKSVIFSDDKVEIFHRKSFVEADDIVGTKTIEYNTFGLKNRTSYEYKALAHDQIAK